MDTVIDGWGLVVCHELLTGGSICLLGSDVVLFYDQLEHPGVWWPNESAIVGDYVHVESPCVEDCTPLSEGCECGTQGECALGLTCNGETCETCPTGSSGCWCFPDETCDIGLTCADFVCG